MFDFFKFKKEEKKQEAIAEENKIAPEQLEILNAVDSTLPCNSCFARKQEELQIQDDVVQEAEVINDEVIQVDDNQNVEPGPVKKFSFDFSFSKLKETISKTGESLINNVVSVVSDKEKIDDDTIDEIEENLIKADLGIDTSIEIAEKLRKNKDNISPSGLKDFLKVEFERILETTSSSKLNIKDNQLNIILVTGVNGTGKTTLIGKLAYRFKIEGKHVLVAAADTFRAAAEEQLEIWTRRAGAQIVRNDGADPASVVYEAIKKAEEEKFDILLIDTAGRLQNKFNLMEELKKIKRVIDKEAKEKLVESILVIDATTGQNGLKQAEVFKEAVDLTSVALTKLDGSAKGGIVIAIAKELKIPVKIVGVGEKLEDVRDFDSQKFVEALF
ncbi:MAG: signal recognition particle-docking protein FtsY [Candidatus Gastranaerophilaceae bacterium]|jgi:fused signal recognition particle receptor